MPKEKTGNTVKMLYDFNTSRSCEILLQNGKWVRTTPRVFRSWGGSRRITYKQDIEPYNGPVYYYGTNKVSKDHTTHHIVEEEGKETKSEKATHEKFKDY